MHIAVTINVTVEDGFKIYFNGERVPNEIRQDETLVIHDRRLVIGQYMADVRLVFLSFLHYTGKLKNSHFQKNNAKSILLLCPNRLKLI